MDITDLRLECLKVAQGARKTVITPAPAGYGYGPSSREEYETPDKVVERARIYFAFVRGEEVAAAAKGEVA